MSHAFMGVLTCARIHSIELDRAFLLLIHVVPTNTAQLMRAALQKCLAVFRG
jgi:hypothetical protein